MNDAYEMYDYGDLFPIVSSSSIRMKEKSKNNTNEAYLKELKRRADEATRKNFTDKLSDRIKELNEVLNTKALEEMIQFIDNRPIKLKGTNFANMEKISGTMKASSDNDIGTKGQAFDVQSVNPNCLKSNVSDAFASYGIQDSSMGEVPSFAEPEPLPAVIPDDMSKGSSYLEPAGDLVTNDEESSVTEPEPLPVNDEVVSAINDYVARNIGPREDTSSSDMSSDFDPIQIETTEVKSSDVDDNNEKDYLTDGQLQEKIADYIGAQRTEDGDYTFPVATIPDETPNDVVRGEDVQVVPEREDTSVSAEIGYADNNVDSHIDESFAEETSGDVSDSLDAVSSTDNIFGDDQNEDTPVYESSDMSSTVNIEATNGSESFESSHVVDPDFGELFGYSKPGGGVDYVSFAPDIMRQFEEARNNVAKLNAEKEEKTREEAESAQSVQSLQSEIEAKVRRLFDNTKQIEREGIELRDQIDSIEQNIDSNKQTVSMLSDVSSQLSDMLAGFTDVSEDEDVKGRSK